MRIVQVSLTAVLTMAGIGAVWAVESPEPASAATEKAPLEKHAGRPVDLAPWAYAWRADRAVQEQPEAYFIPRRLERLDKVYRTAFTALPQDQLKSIYYDMPDLLKPLLPPPKGRLQAGTEKRDFDGRLESQVALVGSGSPLAGDQGTTMTVAHRWQSRAAGAVRRGIVIPLLYAPRRALGWIVGLPSGPRRRVSHFVPVTLNMDRSSFRNTAFS